MDLVSDVSVTVAAFEDLIGTVLESNGFKKSKECSCENVCDLMKDLIRFRK